MTFKNGDAPNFMNMSSNSKHSWNQGTPVEITPEMAARWLSISEGKNVRTISQVDVDLLVQNLSGGLHTTRTIRFHKDGWCCDGQHFLTAILQSGLTAKGIFIEVGLTDQDLPHIDIGKPRTFSTTSKIAGTTANDSDAALALNLEFGLMYHGKETHDQKRFLINKHKIAINFVNEILRGASRKPVAMKRAVVDCYEDSKNDQMKLNRLIRFGEVYSKLDISGGSSDQSAVSLSKFIADTPTSDISKRPEIYKKTIIALDNFMSYNPAKKLYMSEKRKTKFKKLLK